jgi:rubrerythrin
MILHKGKHFIAFILALLLMASPIMGTVACAAENAPEQGFLGKTADYFGSMFGGSAGVAAEEMEQELEAMASSGLFDPLMETVGGYFGNLLKDERLGEVVGNVLEEIAEDESLLHLDTEAIIVMLLRDARLVEILGETIADSLKSEEALTLVERLTGDLEALLKNEQFASFLNRAIVELLQDKQVNAFIFDIIQMLNRYTDQVLRNVTDKKAQKVVLGFVEEIKALLMAPYLSVFDDLLGDPRIAEAIVKVKAAVAALPEDLQARLADDEQYQAAQNNLKSLFLRPLLGDPDDPEQYPGFSNYFLKNVQDDLILQAAVGRLTDELLSEAALSDVYALLDEMMGDMSGITSQILTEVMGGVDGYADGLGLGAKTYKDDYRILVAVEWEVGPYLTHLFECVAFVLGQNSEEMSQIMDKYFGEDAAYIDNISSALAAGAEAEWPDIWICRECGYPYVEAAEEKAFADLPSDWVCPSCEAAKDGFIPPPGTLKFDLLKLLDEYMGDDAGAANGALPAEFEEILGELLSDAFHDFNADLLFLLAGQGDKVMGVLSEMLEALYPYVEEDEEGDLAKLLEDISTDIAPISLTGLVDEKALDGLIDKLLSLTDGLPLQSLSPYLRENADEIGHNLAYDLLNGLADSIEDPIIDERKEAIMAMLKSEERMRRFYLDLGGSDPAKVTAESGDLDIILAVLMEVVLDEGRVQGLLDDLGEYSQPALDNLADHLQSVGDTAITGLRELFGPFLYRAMNMVTIFPLKSEPAERHLDDYIAPENLAEEVRRTWALIADALRDVAGFANESLARFILDYDAIADFATVERFSAINLFYAEIADAEALKQKSAEEMAPELVGSARNLLSGLLPGVAGSLDPAGITGGVNNLLAGLFPAGTYRFSSESLGLSKKDVTEMLASPLDDLTRAAWTELGGLLKPLSNLPAKVLKDRRTDRALGEIAGFVPEAATGAVANLLADDRTAELMMAAVSAMLDQQLAAAGAMVGDSDFQKALEDAMTRVLSNAEFRSAVGELVGDLLSDGDLIDLLEHTLHQARIISIGWPWKGINPFFLIGVNDGGDGKGAFATNRDKRNHTFELYKPDADWNPNVQKNNPVYQWVRGPQEGGRDKIPVASDYHANWRPDGWVYPDPLFKEPSTNKWGGPDLRVHMKGWINDPDENSNPLYYNQYDEHPFLPEGHKFPVCLNQDFSPQSQVNVGLMIPHYYMEMAANNAIFAFTENFINWLDPGRSYAIKAPAEELTDVLNVFLGEDSVRKRIAKPLAEMLSEMAEGLVGEESALGDIVLSNLGEMFDSDSPLKTMAAYLRSDKKLPALLGAALNELPVNAVIGVLQDNEDITGLLEDNLSTVPTVLETLVSTLRKSKNLRDLIGDAAIDIPLDNVRPLLRLQPETLAVVAGRVGAFPVEGVARFLEREERAYRMGYIMADLQPRFMKTLLARPELIELEAALVNEKLGEADYTLAGSLADVIDRVMSNASLDEHLGERLYDFVIKTYDNLKGVFRPLGQFFGFGNTSRQGGAPLDEADY